MTSTPDVQNVPDVWGLLEQARKWAGKPGDGGYALQRWVEILDVALAQRDRFVLVPNRVAMLLREATSEGFEDAGWTDESWADWWVEMRAAWPHVLAAAPKPPEKP